MNKEEIQKKNEAIAKMLGWFQEDGQPDTWFAISDSAKYVVYSLYKDQFKELPFHKDWNYLMKAKEFIDLDKDYMVTITRNMCLVITEKTGVLAGVGTGETCIEATFEAFSMFAKTYNTAMHVEFK